MTQEKLKTVAVVPMKLNNTRLPNKNIKCFKNGNPLCSYILSTLSEVTGIDEVYVYCSNEKITQYLPEQVRYLQRSECLDQDTTKMNEVLACFAKEVDADIYVMAHTTAPFITKESIETGLNAVKKEDYDSAFSVKEVQDFFWKDGLPWNYNLDNIPRTQDLPILYEETSGFYIYKKDVMLRWNRRIGIRPYMVKVGQIEGIDIDEEEDFNIAEAVYNWKNKSGGVILNYLSLVLGCTPIELGGAA